MGQVVVNSEEAMDFVKVQDSENKKTRSGSSPIAGWDLSNPLRVLLVEADDSTRLIIGALLRKCNYKVASVSDGLKAWEFLKARHDSIDLVLTGVDLPTISGYALLTLISEHEICKNIPVIMMSTQYSINTVYKIIVKGAADFLVKPIRINELRNLWRHVWRRQSRVFDLKIQGYSKCDNSNQNLHAEARKREAVDLMGNFDDNHSRRECYSNVGSTTKLDSSQRLDLSLRRYQPDENKMLNHYNASAFTQYFDNSNAKDTDNISDSNTISHSTCLEKDAENHALHRLFSAKPISAKEQRLESSDGSQFTTQADQSNVSDAVVPGVSDSGSEPLYYKQSIQREAALTKFLLKRKERCFDKKVRYENRKTFAVQRPRVKGQFVCHAPSTNRV